jgi:hypothetical protein
VRQHAVVPIKPYLRAEVKFFGRHKGGAIRDGVLLSVEQKLLLHLSSGPVRALSLRGGEIHTRTTYDAW